MKKNNSNTCPLCNKLHNGLYKCAVCGNKSCINCHGMNPTGICKKCKTELDNIADYANSAAFEKGIISGGSIRG